MLVDSPLWFQTIGYATLAALMIAVALLAVSFAVFVFCGLVCTIADEIKDDTRRKERER